MYNESILFMSAFGQNVNWAYGDPAVNQKFKDLYGSNAVAIAPWTSATPLSGELMQASLDALLQNERNLLSAYPDAYVKTLYDGKSNNVQKVIYTPIGDGQSVVSGSGETGNSVTLSAEFGTLGGTASAAMIGATVPAGPFEQGKGWNYGVFGVKNGAPTWFPYDYEAIAKTIGNSPVTYRTINNFPIVPVNSAVRAFDTQGGSSSYYEGYYNNLPSAINICEGNFEANSLIGVKFHGNGHIIGATGTGTGYYTYSGANLVKNSVIPKLIIESADGKDITSDGYSTDLILSDELIEPTYSTYEFTYYSSLLINSAFSGKLKLHLRERTYFGTSYEGRIYGGTNQTSTPTNYRAEVSVLKSGQFYNTDGTIKIE